MFTYMMNTTLTLIRYINLTFVIVIVNDSLQWLSCREAGSQAGRQSVLMILAHTQPCDIIDVRI